MLPRYFGKYVFKIQHIIALNNVCCLAIDRAMEWHWNKCSDYSQWYKDTHGREIMITWQQAWLFLNLT